MPAAYSETHPENWIEIRPEGLYCKPGGFFVDPVRPVDRAVITHGHADHARPGHRSALATPETLGIMGERYGDEPGRQAVAYGETVTENGVEISLHPAGHVLGSAQVKLAYRGASIVISGDYKRRFDATCAPFEPVACDVFVTEATFGLPVFRHPDDREEIAKLLHSLEVFPERAHLVGVYALGKAQRVLSLIRRAGYQRPIYLHGTLEKLTELYRAHGQDFGVLLPATGKAKPELKGEIVLAPPAAGTDRWSRRLPDPVIAVASGWMRVRQRARQRGAELPLIISDHADWDELVTTLDEVDAPTVWVTHGREEALVHHARMSGRHAKALALIGYEEEAE
ncbi:MAG: ligase-associated DNA damage response exonuclease [Alphaproteobacteria bacterium]|nr:ligase-associated DNA damage response exonuclease [Alphaproteobacteria bacterium]